MSQIYLAFNHIFTCDIAGNGYILLIISILSEGICGGFDRKDSTFDQYLLRRN